MYHNHVFKDATEALPKLLDAINRKGPEVSSRAGLTRELTHVGITLTEPWRRELLVQGRKPNLAAQIAETMWVLGGRNDIEFLGRYLPRAGEFSDDGETWRAGYGTRLRRWPALEGHTEPIDQLRSVYEILTKDRGSRQAVASIWDPQLDYQPSKDIPCNNWLSFSSRLGKLDLHVAIRSNDAMWGWSGINAFEWSALQEIMAGLLGVGVGGLHFSTTSFHLYDRHWAKAHQIINASEYTILPTVIDSPRFNPKLMTGREHEALDEFDNLVQQWFHIEKAIRAGQIMDDEVDRFPEPMLQSWLRVIQWWWTGEREYLAPLEGTRLELAACMAVQPPERELVTFMADDSPVARFRVQNDETLPGMPSDFLTQLCQLHLEKEAAYGGSWKKRGEMLGIMANIARKVDRLEGGETADETSADTAGDLLVYLAKYRTWLDDTILRPKGVYSIGASDKAENANVLMRELEREIGAEYEEGSFNPAGLSATLVSDFDVLEEEVLAKKVGRFELVDSMMKDAYLLARMLWEHEATLREDLGDDYRGADVD